MDKHEYKHLMDEIQYLIDQQEYAKAAEIADTIDWRRVRSVMTLGTISDLYRINKRYEDARDIMLMAYDRKPENSQVCYSLCELFLKTGEMADAVEFYKEYERLTTSDDFGRYILQYKMYEANNVSLEERAEVLENLRQRTHQEKWLYELAYLYHRMELETKCVEVCDELILWFGTGEYVNKALELKRLHAPLTPEQQEKYDRRFEKPEDTLEEDGPEDGEPDGDVWDEEQAQEENFESGEPDPAETTRVFDTEEVRRQAGDYAADGDTAPMVKIMDVGQYNTLNLQAEIAAGVNEVLGDTDSITRTLLQPMIDPETGYYDLGSTTEIMNSVSQNPEAPEYVENSEVYFGETGELQQNTGEIQGAEDGAAEEYAAEAFDGEPYAEDGAAEEYAAEAFDGEPYAENEETEDGGDEAVPEGDVTEEFLDPKQDEDTVFLDYPDEEVQEEEPAESIGTQEDSAYADSYIGYVEKDSDSEKEAGESVSIADRVMEQMRLESLETQKKLENEALTAQPPEPMARALTQEPDGQIRLVVPEGKTLEKQITGQLSIEDIRAEWERMKQESREKQEEEVRQRVQRQTGKMFTEFEEAIRDNILRQMEQKEEPSLYENPEAVQQDGEETEQEETGGWAMDEWMSDTGEPEDEAAAPEEKASEEYAENAGDDTSDKDADGAENAEGTVEPESVPEKTGEGSEEVPEESEKIPEESEEIPEESEEIPEETEEIPEESEEIPEETEEIFEESSAVSGGSEETAEEEQSREGQAEEEQSGESWDAAEEEEGYEYEDTEEPAEEVNESAAGDSWEDDEYPDFSEEEKAVSGAKPDEEEASKEDEDQGEEALNDREAEESAGEGTSSEVPSVRPLTDEEESLFGELVRGRSAREQLVKAIDSISMAAYAGNLIITSEESSSALEMAKNMIREIKQTDSNFSGKAAKISGKKLSGKDVSEFLEQLKNGAIIIESASQLSENTLADLYRCMQQDSYGLLVILTDTKKKMNLFLKENKKFVPLFSARVDLQPLSNDVLAEYAQQYAREREYSIDDLGMLALHTRIDEMQTAKHSVTKAEIEQLMDAAIHSAAKKNMGHFFDILLGRRYDEEDMLIITEKDFE